MVKCKCGSEKYHTEQNGIHLEALCDECGSHIKFIPQKPPQLYIGKYKGKLISEIQDLQYLEWYLGNVRCSATLKQAIADRIETIKNYSA